MATVTLFGVLRRHCGLSQQEAADWLGSRLDSVKNWDGGRRTCPSGVLAALRDLALRLDAAAAEAVQAVADTGAGSGEAVAVELGYATDDAEAQSLGWPSAGVHQALLARVAVGLPVWATAILVPRGSTPATAAAADAHCH